MESKRPTHVIVRPIPMDYRGYAANGVYYGLGDRLYVADPNNHSFSRFFRALDDQTAVAKAKAMYRDCTVEWDPNPRHDTVVTLNREV